jgi:chromosome segregation protein
MEDVIFSGSDARKPTAAAEVRLKLTEVAQSAVTSPDATVDALLDDQPLSTRDVEIGRRLYRSGESEYLIDGEVCRLKDVHDLLMDSGLGVKAYSVIEQGKIGQILSSRPAERRTLIEEAAGVTKYKARRRTAELKLAAAQQNLTRVDDIVFEVEKQRGALKRQAARARRYKRLREDLRRWEQVQFARRHESLSVDIERADARLVDARTRETAAAARVAELETALETVRLGLTDAEAGATRAREDAHLRELQIERRQQQIQFDRQQIEELAARAEAFAAESRELESRRGPAAEAIGAQRAAAAGVGHALEEAARRVEAAEADYREAFAAVQKVEEESDTTRAAVMASSSTLSALRQARDHAAAVRDRVAAEQERLDLEARELSAEADRVRAGHAEAAEALGRARTALAAAAETRLALEAEVARHRAEREQLAQLLGERQRDLAGREARLRSLEEIEGGRATFGDAARFVLAEAGEALRTHGAVADHLQVDRSYERAVDALLGDLLQHVLVERADDVTVALEQLSGRDAGRCGFLVLEDAGTSAAAGAEPPLVVPARATPLRAVARAAGPHADAVGRLIGRALIVERYADARALAATLSVPVATMAGDVFRGGGLVESGSRQDVRGILESRAEMLALREEVQAVAAETREMSVRQASVEAALAAADGRLADVIAEQHTHEKAIVGLEAQDARASAELERVNRRLGVVATERRRAADEATGAESRRDEAVTAIARHEDRQREAEGRLGGVLESLQSARQAAEARLRLVTEARTGQAGLTERAAGLDTEIARLEEASRDLEARIDARRADIARTETRRDELRQAIADNERLLDEDVAALQEFRSRLRVHDEELVALRGDFSAREAGIRTARHQLEAVRAEVMQAEVVRATAASDLGHLAATCLETMGLSLDDVVTRVGEMEAAGELVAPRRAATHAGPGDDDDDDDADDDDDDADADAAGDDDEGEGDEDEDEDDDDEDEDDKDDEDEDDDRIEAGDRPDGPRDGDVLGPDEVIADLKQKIERLGPVNMMAIEQFDELEARHTFLTTQRQDLLDSIAQTGEAIRRIDKTTRERFAEAFESINLHFGETFRTLFGGGRAGLVLIDQENDPESGVDIIAQPPGKRLQNVQLLSGGEKALTAMALMFAIFKHRPSPFCLLDEIDAPLDDANISRFVSMLQGLQDGTQFILITHNRKTMEIADRLYGVTMEEPGVSKLISVELNGDRAA